MAAVRCGIQLLIVSRVTRLNRTIRRAVQRQVEKTESKKPPLRNRLVKIVLSVVVGIPGVLAALLSLLPRVSVTPIDPSDPARPFESSFTVTNTGFIPLRDAGVELAPYEIDGGAIPFDEHHRPQIDPSYKGRIIMPALGWDHHDLGIDEKFTISLGHPFLGLAPGATLGGADIGIVVHYRPWLIPYEQTRIFRFVTHRYPNGTISWFSHPLN